MRWAHLGLLQLAIKQNTGLGHKLRECIEEVQHKQHHVKWLWLQYVIHLQVSFGFRPFHNISTGGPSKLLSTMLATLKRPGFITVQAPCVPVQVPA